jgi:hypothetical protein
MITRKGSVVAALAGIACTGLLLAPTPATATTTLNMGCDDGPIIACSVGDAASGQWWTVDGLHYGPGDGLSDIAFHCWPGNAGHFYNVSVTYLNTSGSRETESAGAWCEGSTN